MHTGPLRHVRWIVLLAITGCTAPPPSGPPTFDPQGAFYLQPLAVQQHQAYPHTVTGRFVSLVDFEPTPANVDDLGGDPLSRFSIVPPEGGRLRLVLDVTRTGTGALHAVLPPGATLEYAAPFAHDLRPYALLSVAVHSRAVRNDLQLALSGPDGQWKSRRRLLRPGWNTVLVDLNAIVRSDPAAMTRFDRLRVTFADADEPVEFHLDDILLSDNRRTIPGTPVGLELTVDGLNYTLRLPGWDEPIELQAGTDGLWRLGGMQPTLQLTGPAHPQAHHGEDLILMGDRRAGLVEFIEINPLRVRIRNTWYFISEKTLWLDMNLRRIRWEYTFYGDGRWVTDLLVNNAGGETITTIRLTTPFTAAFCDGTVGRVWEVRDLQDPAVACSMLAAAPSAAGDRHRENYASPATMRILLGRSAGTAGDPKAAGFDKSQGCYTVRAVRGNCRVLLTPTAPLQRPVLRVVGPWKGEVTANCDGLPLRPVVRLDDGVLLAVPGTLTRPALIEVRGPVGVLDE